MKYMILSTVLAGLAVLGGCGMQMDMPDNFVAVDNSNTGAYEIRGVSADGVVLGARREENPKNGTLVFWSEAVKRELTARNYTFAGSEDITSAGALAGKLMTFSASRGGRPFTYLAAVFVKKGLLGEGEVIVAEAGGEASIFKPRQDEIRNALLTIR
jgi:hypothetical protein